MQPFAVGMQRIGHHGDGGYVLPERAIVETDTLVSIGIATDWSFESDFHRLRPSAAIHMYDRSSGPTGFLVSALRQLLDLRGSPRRRLFEAWRYVRHAVRFARDRSHIGFAFRRRWVVVSANDGRRDISLSEVFDQVPPKASVMLKIDVEGAEYSYLNDLGAWMVNSGKVTVLIVELHDFDLRIKEVEKFVSDVAESFVVAHIHVNNYGSINSGIPSVVEMTMCPRSWVGSEKRQCLPLDGLDFPNNPSASDPVLQFI